MKGIVINPVKPLKLQRTSTHKANLIGALCIEFNTIRKKKRMWLAPKSQSGSQHWQCHLIFSYGLVKSGEFKSKIIHLLKNEKIGKISTHFKIFVKLIFYIYVSINIFFLSVKNHY